MKRYFYIIALAALSAHTQAQPVSSMAAITASTAVNPAELVTLNTAFSNSSCTISWQAIPGAVIRRYELQKSEDGEHFSYLSSFAGTAESFSISDNSLFTDANHYRLKIIDGEGNFFYSNISSVYVQSEVNRIKILPSLTENRVNIWMPATAKASKVSILNAAGNVISENASFSSSTNITAVETGKLAHGMYRIQLLTAKGETIQLRFNR